MGISTVFPALSSAAGVSPVSSIDAFSAQFREFYIVLDRAARSAMQLQEDQLESAMCELGDQLCQLIEMQTMESHRRGGRVAVELESHARYLKAALADEVLLNIDWPGRSTWCQHLLEARLFHTSQAGEKVFDDLTRVLVERDSGQRPVAMLYLHVLSLGFLGKYRGMEDLTPVADCRRALFQAIYQRPADLQGRGRTVCPAAYDSTLTRPDIPAHPRLERRWLALLLGSLALLLCSEMLWLWLSWPVRNRLAGAWIGLQAMV